MLRSIKKMLRRLKARLTGDSPVSDADRVNHYASDHGLQPIPIKTDGGR